MNDPVSPIPKDGPVYLDHNATTPVDPRVVDALLPFLAGGFGNPSSTHAYGAAPRAALARARRQVAALIGAAPEEIVLTGSGSEANALALRGALLAAGAGRNRIVTQATEHPAVLQTCAALRRLHGADVTVLPVDERGVLDPAVLAAALDGRTAVVSVMAANNETGTLQPVAELARLAHRHGALFHCDAAQAAGKVPLDARTLGADLMTVVGHKMYAPKGVAALRVRAGVRLEPLLYGGGQEGGLRAGTENVALAVALGTAAGLAAAELADGGPGRVGELRDRLHRGLTRALPGRVRLNGCDHRLPNTLNVSVEGVLGHELLAEVPQLAASTGSACHSGEAEPSPVLRAMGLDDARALGAVRLSLGRWTSEADVDRAVTLLTGAVRALAPRAYAGARR
ncbi:cysteine desulfurase [Streptomyces sp. J2-1]|uniref:cysteine desulfurase family protein n=1 Tax=Streptomyces corallincola TaxID=2851888 RepID=UPI001C391B3A|nr:cysteine desulfurase family protein [Streptomyces corallincola]MBV2355667.1 cysteine desulfurase [Streptomyces corallincola]